MAGTGAVGELLSPKASYRGEHEVGMEADGRGRRTVERRALERGRAYQRCWRPTVPIPSALSYDVTSFSAIGIVKMAHLLGMAEP